MPKKKKAGSTNFVDRLKRNMKQLDEVVAASKVDPMPPAKPPGRGSPQFVLRYTDEMREKIARRAKSTGRSINAEIIALLERAMSQGDAIEQLETSMGEIFERVEKLERSVADHDDQLHSRDPNPDD